jgi:transcriptional antiterminator NusG
VNDTDRETQRTEDVETPAADAGGSPEATAAGQDGAEVAAQAEEQAVTGAAAEAPVATGGKPTKKWYVIKAINGRENRVRENIKVQLRVAGLADEVEDLLIPVEYLAEVKRGKKVTTTKTLYPGYIYAKMKPTNDVIEAIRNADGCTGFLGADPQRPDPLTAEEAERILRVAEAGTAEERKAASVQIPYELGDKVKVREGTFAGMDGMVDEINREKGLLKVVITVFGRQTPVELEVWQVESIS